ncbi:hypothetical protein QBZ16_002917 [Prototheca wickerhamii]|uniref:Uncharacterized protein n=1 Tax=Prototheca wickerhamii TaxID=3111 RepID=A0AAD9IKB5_PROWI|nr:hypothetical protein QBZ16_002917 [Prototheca wickerhamii]
MRNGSLGATILATAAAQLAQRTLAVLTNTMYLNSVRELGKSDPIAGGNSIASPQVKLGLAFGTLLLCIMCLAQFVRFSLHQMYIMQVIASDPRRYAHLLKLSRVFVHRSSIYFSLGLRFLFLFAPAIMWCVGPLALLITTVLQTGIMFALDLVPVSEDWLQTEQKLIDEDEQRLLTAESVAAESVAQSRAQKSIHLPQGPDHVGVEKPSK